ncbi:hypothetical protein PC118_g18192 [Phytophthora cactorum]|uniref:Uncharacterized protein n=1 Tax=Phytophthora cactorum TaxID=29920 RepID=A0A329RB66_9STRA|nr:hypothetical protein PC117_g19718 [Phytophthora cactorum]KAG2968151.1 hypothetical protein PC118_g18192 [Phytophthora cactorum]RAW21731.1 hypothetical protein PC110_g21826 [Phytophthora cactorum]RAW21930.1 hypothetical protein PC110_g21626 [Phytophthora cactorum]RAW22638.1 hypothetical protein PC110_g20919 [Phytophthora cactorum]
MMATGASILEEPVGVHSQSQGSKNKENVQTVFTDAFAASELAHFLSQDTDSGADSVKYETQAPKPKTRAEKEVIRKRKYHHRLRNERESLRQLFGELSVQLQDLRLSKGLYTISAEDSVALVNSRNWKDVALLRRQLRHRSETEQVQLFTAARLQAMYIDKLRAQLPGNSTCLLVFR